jgi:hypothetical protein
LGQIIGPLTEAVSMFNDANQSVSSIHDPNLGKYDPSAKSGKAILALQQQGTLGTSNFMDNLTRSIRYEGKIINSLLFPIYGRPGRVARILTGEDEPDTVTMGQPGMPNQPKQPGQQPTVTLTEHAHFNVVVKVTKSFDRRREQEAQTLGEVIGNAPALLNVLGDLYFKNQDGPGHDEMAERMKATLDPRVLAMMQAKQQGQAGPEQMQHLQQQLQQVTQQAQQMHQQIQSDTAKYQAQMQIETMKATADTDRAMKLAAVNNAAKIEIARITAAKQAADTILEAQEEQIALNHEAVQSHLDRQHDVGMAAQQHDQQMQQGAQQAQVAQQSQQADQQHQAQMAQQQQDAQAQQAQQQPQGGQ